MEMTTSGDFFLDDNILIWEDLYSILFLLMKMSIGLVQ